MLIKTHKDYLKIRQLVSQSAQNGHYLTLISPISLGLANKNVITNCFYGHYIYVFGVGASDVSSGLNLMSQSSLIIYMRVQYHYELMNFISQMNVPYILLNKVNIQDDMQQSSFKVDLDWLNKTSLKYVALEMAKMCLSEYKASLFVSELSKNSGLLGSINSKWRKLWYTVLPVRRRSRVYKCLNKNNWKRKA